ncbi:MAG TPA: ferredoxin [Polyangiaceae bacterium]|nr:ferredoxin [Polyangiaceae bacterium]
MTLTVHVEASRCTRCGACAALRPTLFDVSGAASRTTRDATAHDRTSALAARLICPTDAIRVNAPGDEADDHATASPLYDELAAGAERVRWSLDAIPWNELDPARAPAELRAMVREMAFSENATYSATQRFLESFYDDVDFTRWISVWFYEETKHPHVLLEWLRRVGEPVASDFVTKARVSTPFMRSFVGTLVTNVISEVTAAQAYRSLSTTSPEPVMAHIARAIAGDEARHAASFFRFARAWLDEESPEAARRSRARGLEVLQAWLGGASPATHPVAQMISRLKDAEIGELDGLAPKLENARARVVRLTGLLLDLPLRDEADVGVELRQLLASHLGGRIHDAR